MDSTKRAAARNTPAILFCTSGEIEAAILDRAVTLVDRIGGELQVCCPVILPPVPYTSVTPEALPVQYDERQAREDARRIAISLMSSLSERNVDAHVETIVCRSVAEGVLSAAERLDSDLVILPHSESSGSASQTFDSALERIWSNSKVPVWVMHGGAQAGRTVIGLIDFESASSDGAEAAEAVALTAARLARGPYSEARLLSCAKHPLAMAPAMPTGPAKLMSLSERKERRVVRRLFEIADRYGIDRAHVHVHHGSERDVLDQIVDPLDVGLIVVSGEPKKRFGGLVKRKRAGKLVDVPCDLLVLGETEVPHPA